MMDRVGSFSVSQGRVDRADRGAARPGRVGDFEDMMRRATEQTNPDAVQTNPNPASPLRLGRIGSRARQAGPPLAAPGATSGSEQTAVAAPPRTRATVGGAADSAPAPVAPEPSGGPTEASAPTAATSPGTRFVRSSAATCPHLVRFTEVPESAQYPLGPYRQAPPESGGDWWLVNPFTGPEPWKALQFPNGPLRAALETQPVPADFVQVFGPRPDGGTAAVQWEQDLSFFQGTGLPEGFNEAQLEAATAEFEAWGMGEPVFYQGRYGWQVRFPDSQLPMFETTASTALLVPHLVIAEHQVRLIQEGVTPSRYHPWLPERLRQA